MALSDVAKKLLLGRGVGDDMVTVEDYGGHHSNPRITLCVLGGCVNVIYTIEQLRAKLEKYPNVRGRDLAEFLT